MFLIPDSHYEVRRSGRKGRGVFAKEDLPPGTVIGDYLGLIVKDSELARLEKKNGGACYALDYSGNTSVYPIDVRQPDVHLINHSCAPNASTFYHYGHTLVFAVRRIFAGEEISYDYGFDPDNDDPDFLHPCFCGSPVCRGTMYTSDERIKRYGEFIERTTKGQKYKIRRAGSILAPLDKYPKRIKDYKFYDIFAALSQPKKIFSDRKLPSLRELRRRLREEGRPLSFSRLNIAVWGIREGEVLALRLGNQK